MKSSRIVAPAAIAIGAAVLAAWVFWPRSLPSLDDGGRYIFVPSLSAPEVTAIDSQTDEVVAILEFDFIPQQIVVSDATGELVASNLEKRTLTIVNLQTHQTEAVIQLEIKPDHMQLDPSNYLVAVGDIEGGTVSIISLHQRKRLSRIDGLQEPYNLTFSTDGDIIYVANRAADQVTVIDVARGLVSGGISTYSRRRQGEPGGVTNLTGTPDGRYGFATLNGGNLLSIIDLHNEKEIKTLRTGKDPWRAYGTADGQLMLVPNNGDGTISIIDTAALEVAATIPGGKDMISVNTGWFDSVAFVISSSEDNAIVIDLLEMKKIGDIPLSSRPGWGVVTPDGKKLYVALSGSDKVAVIDTQKRMLLATIDNVGNKPWGATMGRSNNYCH